MKTFVFCMLTLFPNAHSHMPNVYEFCSYVVAHQGQAQGPQSSCDATTCLGKPGKRGQPGNRGLPGLKGDHGVCDLEKLKRLEDELRRKTMLIPKSIYCLLDSENDVQDNVMTASSTLTLNREPYLGNPDDVIVLGSGGTWCPSTNQIGEWVQIDLGRSKYVSGVVTQGSKNNKWVTSFKIACVEDVGDRVTFVSEQGKEKIFIGNSDTSTKIYNMLPEPLTCRRIRIYPQTWNNGICLRLYMLNGNCHGGNTKYQFLVRSAGYDDENLAQIQINGVDHQLGGRGHNVVVLNAFNLEIETKVFDTHGLTEKTREMIAYLNQIPYGSLIAIAIHDSTNANLLNAHDVDVLESLGAGSPGCPIKVAVRDSWAFITQKVMPGVQIPEWKTCSHIARHSGIAKIEATANFGRFYKIDAIPMNL